MPYRISQTSFARTLYPLFDDPWIRHLSPTETTRLVESYWRALKLLCPQSVEDPRAYLLMKTAGVSTIHQILPDLVALLVSKGVKIREITPDHFRKLLEEIPEFKDEFWNGKNLEGAKRYLGEAGAKHLAGIIRAHLPKPAE
jgi:hypothetical protein